MQLVYATMLVSFHYMKGGEWKQQRKLFNEREKERGNREETICGVCVCVCVE